MHGSVISEIKYLNETYLVLSAYTLIPFLRDKYTFIIDAKREFVSDVGDNFNYFIQSGMLYLEEIAIYGLAKPFPLLKGNLPEIKLHRHKLSRKEQRKTGKWYSYSQDDTVRYTNIQDHLYYSGFMVIGQKIQSDEYRWNCPGLYPHICSKILKIRFVNGQPKHIQDFSEQAVNVRENLKMHDPYGIEAKVIERGFHKMVYNFEQNTA